MTAKTQAPAPVTAPAAPLPYNLTVTHDFGPAGPYTPGQLITDDAEKGAFLAKWPSNYAVKVAKSQP